MRSIWLAVPTSRPGACGAFRAPTVMATPKMATTRGCAASKCSRPEPPNVGTYMSGTSPIRDRVPSDPQIDKHNRFRRATAGQHLVLVALRDSGLDDAAGDRAHHFHAGVVRPAVLPGAPLRIEGDATVGIWDDREATRAHRGNSLLQGRVGHPVVRVASRQQAGTDVHAARKREPAATRVGGDVALPTRPVADECRRMTLVAADRIALEHETRACLHDTVANSVLQFGSEGDRMLVVPVVSGGVGGEGQRDERPGEPRAASPRGDSLFQRPLRNPVLGLCRAGVASRHPERTRQRQGRRRYRLLCEGRTGQHVENDEYTDGATHKMPPELAIWLDYRGIARIAPA